MSHLRERAFKSSYPDQRRTSAVTTFLLVIRNAITLEKESISEYPYAPFSTKMAL
jgi:hypothetical protein